MRSFFKIAFFFYYSLKILNLMEIYLPLRIYSSTNMKSNFYDDQKTGTI